MHYHAKWLSGERLKTMSSKVVCVGRNYAAHAKELNNPIPDTPLLFIKPNSALTDIENVIQLSSKEIHYECELAILMGPLVDPADGDNTSKVCPVGMALALDLTLRALQSELKRQGHPWERAKSFDHSCPISGFVPYQTPDNLEYKFYIGDKLVQHGRAANMLFGIEQLIDNIQSQFTLVPGDIVLTGTPEGVGRLEQGDKLRGELMDTQLFSTRVE